MKCLILSWNGRGLGNQERRKQVKELVCKFKPNIILLQETKLMGVTTNIIRSLCRFVTPHWLTLPVVGTVGFFLLIWDLEEVEVEVGLVDSFFVTAVTTFKGNSTKWMVTGVYGPTMVDRSLRTL